jgi:RNA polymerase sigma-70 factor (ECF subfamily)
VAPDTAPDAELWTRAAAGDRPASGELFERHVEAVWNHAYRLTASWSQAEDLTSSTFLLGVAEVSVRSRLSRARARLRTKLEDLS